MPDRPAGLSALGVLRVGLSGEDELYGLFLVCQEFHDPARVPEQQVAAFVAGEPSGKADRQRLGIENFLGPVQLGMV